jgi:hypothetical protein
MSPYSGCAEEFVQEGWVAVTTGTTLEIKLRKLK